MKMLKCLAAWATAAALPLVTSLASAADAPLHAEGATSRQLEQMLSIPEPAASGAERGFRPRPGETPKPHGRGRADLLVTFVTGSAELAPDARKLLDTLAQAMRSNELAGVSFLVQGHADARGDTQTNDALSLARAQAVLDYLTSQQGILAERLKAEGRGSREPLNKSRVDAPENRRVTVISFRDIDRKGATSSTGSKP